MKKPSLGGFWGRGWTLKTWNGQKSLEWVKYDWNGSPQPQMVGFSDLVGTSIAPVSKKAAVKCNLAAR